MADKHQEEEAKRDNIGAEANDLLATKATFVAGIVLIIAIIKDILKVLFTQVPAVVNSIFLIVAILSFILFVCTEKFDKIMGLKGVADFGNFLTIMSIIVFIIENSVLEYSEGSDATNGQIIVTIIGASIIFGGMYLLFQKKKF